VPLPIAYLCGFKGSFAPYFCSGSPPPFGQSTQPEEEKNQWGYHYDYHEYIGPVQMTGPPDKAMAYFRQHPKDIFPFRITGCSAFVEGAKCTLHATYTALHGVGDVRVSLPGPTSFRFTVVSNDYFDLPGGTITFSLSQSHGSLYLSQHAEAKRGTFFGWAGVHARKAKETWILQGDNLRRILTGQRAPIYPYGDGQRY
jgi:hypothetical protein